MGRILVTGGTGVLGGLVVRRLVDDGHQVRVLSRRPAPETLGGMDRDIPGRPRWVVGDLVSGTGLAAALDGVDRVVHCASDSRHWRSDLAAARHLIDAARAAERPHLVYISIVGIDRVPFAYYRAKLEIERMLESSGLPWTVLRTTQFHDLVLVIAQRLLRPPVALVPAGVLTQPIDPGEVADRLVELVTAPAAGRVADMGGPRRWEMGEAARAVLAASGRTRRIVRVPVPGRMMAAIRAGGLTTPDRGTGRRTFEEFLGSAPLRDATYGAAHKQN